VAAFGWFVGRSDGGHAVFRCRECTVADLVLSFNGTITAGGTTVDEGTLTNATYNMLSGAGIPFLALADSRCN
jgi:hypothetical protein